MTASTALARLAPSAAPERRLVDLATGPVSVSVGGAGPALLLLHRDIGPSPWGAFHERLASHFSVFAPDLPGFGESPRAEWARSPRDLVAITLATTAELGLENFVVVGLGFGGWVAAEMAVFTHTRMRHMVLVAPAGLKPDDGFILDQMMEEAVSYVRAGFTSGDAFESYFPDAQTPEFKAGLDQSRETIARVSWKPYMYSHELPHSLRNVPLPTTLLWGDCDRVMPLNCGSGYLRSLPNSNLQVFPGAGHFLEMERPDEVAASIVQVALLESRKD